MRVALDTNVLVRFLTNDDDKQSAVAAEVIEQAATIALSTVVFCETAWVLRRAYKFGHRQIAAVFREVIESKSVQVDRPALETGLVSLERGGDFADGVILFDAERAGANRLLTFDRRFVAMDHSNRVELLGTQ